MAVAPLEIRVAFDQGYAQYKHEPIISTLPPGTVGFQFAPSRPSEIWQFYVWTFGEVDPAGPTDQLYFEHWQEGVYRHDDITVHSIPGYSPVVVRKGSLPGDPIEISTLEELWMQGVATKMLPDGTEMKLLRDVENYNYCKDIPKYIGVNRIFRHWYEGPLIRINTNDGLVDASPNHSVILRNGMLADAKKIKPGDHLAMPNLKYISGQKWGLFVGHEDLAWLYGFFVAEGNTWGPDRPVKGGPQDSITLSNKDRDLLEKAQNIYEENFHRKSSIGSQNDKGVYTLFMYGYKVKQWFDQLYTARRKKRVPSFIINSPQNIQETFLEGFYDGDGLKNPSKSGLTQEFPTDSQVLAEGIRFLELATRGKSCYVYSPEGEDYVRVKVRKGDGRDPRGMVKRVHRINYKGWLYDLECEDPHTFTTGIGNIRVHNSLLDYEYPVWAYSNAENPHHLISHNNTGAPQKLDMQLHMAVFTNQQDYVKWYCDLILLGLRNWVDEYLFIAMGIDRSRFDRILRRRRRKVYQSKLEGLLEKLEQEKETIRGRRG